MSKEVLQAVNLKSVITYSVCGIIMGCILTFIPLSTLLDLIIVIVGLAMVVINGYAVYKEFNEKKETSNQTLLDVLGVLLGFILLVIRNQVVTILIAIYLFIEPVAKIIMAKGERSVVMKQIPTIALGVILLVGGFAIVEVVFKILGIVLLVVSILYFGYNYLVYKRSGVKIIK